MTKGDKIKLRAELAGKAMAAMIGERERIGREFGFQPLSEIALGAVRAADALMAELGLSLDKEDHPAYDPS